MKDLVIDKFLLESRYKSNANIGNYFGVIGFGVLSIFFAVLFCSPYVSLDDGGEIAIMTLLGFGLLAIGVTVPHLSRYHKGLNLLKLGNYSILIDTVTERYTKRRNDSNKKYRFLSVKNLNTTLEKVGREVFNESKKDSIIYLLVLNELDMVVPICAGDEWSIDDSIADKLVS